MINKRILIIASLLMAVTVFAAQKHDNDNADGVSAGVHGYEDPTKGRDLTSRGKRTVVKYSLPKDLKDGIKIASLADAKCDKGAIMNLVQNIENGKYHTVDSLLIVYKGKLILEEYFNSGKIGQPHLQMSITKSVVACAMGKAIELGFVKSEEDLILDYLPSVDKSKLQPGVAQIRIKDILTMRSGLNYKEKNAKQQIKRAKSRKEHINRILTKSQSLTPGKVFKYKSTDPDLVGHIIANTTGMNVEQFAKIQIFTPMGIGPYKWGVASSTLSKCAAGLDLRSRDMLKLGLMLRDGGRFNGKQILPEAWVRKMIKTQYKNPSYPHSYGYFWWTHNFDVEGKKLFCHSARGALGQFIYYVPSLDLLVVFTSTNRKNMKIPFNAMEQELLPAFIHPDKKTPFNPTAAQAKTIPAASEVAKPKSGSGTSKPGDIIYEDNMQQGWILKKSKFTAGEATVELNPEVNLKLSVKPIGEKFLFVTLRKKIKPLIMPEKFEVKLKLQYEGDIGVPLSIALFDAARSSQAKPIKLANIPKDGQWHEVVIKSQHLRARPKGSKLKKLIRIFFSVRSKKPISGTIKLGKLQIIPVH
jgi:CubicO group peptidase (beta-lactamase class C family)